MLRSTSFDALQFDCFRMLVFTVHSPRALPPVSSMLTTTITTKSWRSDTLIILPGWECHTGGSRSKPTVHRCSQSGRRLWVARQVHNHEPNGSAAVRQCQHGSGAVQIHSTMDRAVQIHSTMDRAVQIHSHDGQSSSDPQHDGQEQFRSTARWTERRDKARRPSWKRFEGRCGSGLLTGCGLSRSRLSSFSWMRGYHLPINDYSYRPFVFELIYNCNDCNFPRRRFF